MKPVAVAGVPASPCGFMLCPAALLQGVDSGRHGWQQQVYQWAFEQAQAVVRPSILERDLLGVWN
jgi:hypothetical protein